MKDRIRQIMESQHMTQKTFANFIGMSEGSLSSVYNGRTRPTLNIVEAIKNKIPAINTDWLMFGKGQMYVDQATSAESQPDSVAPASPEQMLAFDDDSPAGLSAGYDARSQQGVVRTPKNKQVFDVKIFDKPQRQITEIRVFFDDQTWESFVPKK